MRSLTLAAVLLALASGALLLTGYLTRLAAIVAVLAGTGSLCSWFAGPNLDLFDSKMTAVLATVIAAAVICLGPGAFSLDGRLFGRREIIIPKTPHNT